MRHRNVSLLGSAIGIERYGSIALSYDRNSLMASRRAWRDKDGWFSDSLDQSPIEYIGVGRSPQHLVSSPSNPNRNRRA